MCEYRSDYGLIDQIKKTIHEEKGIVVDFNEVEARLADTRFGYVAVFCRDVGIPGSWEIIVADDNKRQLREAKKEPAELVFIIKSNSQFARSKVKNFTRVYSAPRSLLLARVCD